LFFFLTILTIVKITKDNFHKIAGLAGLVMAASAFFLPLENPDLFWYFSAARYMAAHGGVPQTDFLSWTMQGREWINFEWLSQLIFYLLYKLGGFKLLVIFKGTILLAAVLAIWRTAALHGRQRPAWLYLPFLAAGMLPGGDLRAETFSLFFFALVIYGLERSRLEGGGSPSPGKYLAAAGFFALWTNLHAGYLYGLLLVFIYFAGSLAEEALHFTRGRSSVFKPGRSVIYLKYFASGLAASLINPYGWKIYKVIVNHQRSAAAMQEYIQEWRSFDVTSVYQAPYTVMLLGACGLLLWRLFSARRAFCGHFLAILLFAYSASLHCRFIPFFMLAALPYSLALLPRNAAQGIKKYALLALQILAFSALFRHYSHIWPNYTGRADAFPAYSEGLSDFLKSHKDRLSKLGFYNYWGWGGFLGYKLYPDYKVFLDGRYIFHEMLGETQSAPGPEKWKALMDKYRVELAVIPADGKKIPIKGRIGGGRELVLWRPAYLARMPEKDWAVIYWDRRALALVRRSAVNAAWLKSVEYQYLRSGDCRNMFIPALEGHIKISALEKEARRFLRDDKAAYDTSAGAEVRYFMNALKDLCADKSAKCRLY